MTLFTFQISLPKVSISMRFPCKLQVGFKLNQSQTLTDDIVELKASPVSFKSLLTITFSYNQDINVLKYGNQSFNGDCLTKGDQMSQLILYAVYARRKIAIGLLPLNLIEIGKRGMEVVKVSQKWERCPDKLAFVELEIKVKRREQDQSIDNSTNINYNQTGRQQEQVEQKDKTLLVCENQRVEQWKQEIGCNETVKKYGNGLSSPPIMHRIPNLKLLTEFHPSQRMFHQKYIKIGDKKEPGDKCRFRKKSSQDLLFEKSLELKGFEMSGFDLGTPEDRQKNPVNSNFLSPEDEQYVRSLKIQILPNSLGEDESLSQSLPIHPQLLEKYPISPSESQILEGLQSPRSSFKQFLRSSISFPSSRAVLVLQKKLALTEQYYKSQLQKYSKKLLVVEQERQDLVVELSLKQDEIKWASEERQRQQKDKTRIRMADSMKSQKHLLLQGEQYSITKLKHTISNLEFQIQSNLQRINLLTCELESERKTRSNYQQKVGVYYVRAENDRQTIAMLNMELIKLNNIIKDFVYDKEKREKEIVSPPLTSREKIKYSQSLFSDRKNRREYEESSEGTEVDERVNQLMSHVVRIEDELRMKKERQMELEHEMISLSNKLRRLERREKDMVKFEEERGKYLDDIRYLAQRVEDLENEASSLSSINKQNQSASEAMELENQSLKQEAKKRERMSMVDQENIREFEKELAEKYKLIYSLENSLKDEKEKSRSLSRSIEGRGRVFEFSFNHQCSHNFDPLLGKVRDILKVSQKNRFEVVKSMKVEEKDAYEILLVRHYDYFQNVLKEFVKALEEMAEKSQARSPRGSMSKFPGGM